MKNYVGAARGRMEWPVRARERRRSCMNGPDQPSSEGFVFPALICIHRTADANQYTKLSHDVARTGRWPNHHHVLDAWRKRLRNIERNA